jgi:putative ABC transport system permease protein
MNPFPLVVAMLRRHAIVSAAFVVLVALAVGVGAALTAQERALRSGSARAADRFDLIVAAPGSQTDLLLKVVFLQPGSVELLEGAALRRLMSETRAEFVAPIGFGDSFEGNAVVGTIAAFVDHLAQGKREGRVFTTMSEAVVGAAVPLTIGGQFHVAHGHGGEEEEAHEHHPQALTVVGRIPPTGTPWDRAVLVPIEFVWSVHGLGDGHGHADEHEHDAGAVETGSAGTDVGEDHDHQHSEDEHEHSEDEHTAPDHLGPPFDLDTMPGIPAAVVKPQTVAGAYGLRSAWRTTETMAFYPAEVLVQLYEILGDIRLLLSVMTVATQVLLVAAILIGLFILLRLYRHRFAVLRALGASRGYIFAVAWTFSFLLIGIGSLLGLAVAVAVAQTVSLVIEQGTGIALAARIGPTEMALAGAISAVGALLALVPAALLYRQPVVESLRESA